MKQCFAQWVSEQRKLESQKEGCPLKNQEMRLQDAHCSPSRIGSDSKRLKHSHFCSVWLLQGQQTQNPTVRKRNTDGNASQTTLTNTNCERKRAQAETHTRNGSNEVWITAKWEDGGARPRAGKRERKEKGR